MNKSILLIGKPHSSKTVFLSQFYSRLRKNKSKLALYKPVDDLSPISAAREALSNGDSPIPTPAEQNIKFYLPIQIADEKVDLKCPEYGGEQVTSVVENRELNKEWVKAVDESDNWILFIRLNNVNKALDITEITYSEQHQPKNPKNAVDDEYRISDQSFFVELLQILLHSKKHDYHIPNDKVRLTIVLTCWDEMNVDGIPSDVLTEKLPLLTAFIRSNWALGMINIIGLSAQGFSLDIPENKDKYLIDGPEEFGYLVLQDGTHSNDITQLIAQSL